MKSLSAGIIAQGTQAGLHDRPAAPDGAGTIDAIRNGMTPNITTSPPEWACVRHRVALGQAPIPSASATHGEEQAQLQGYRGLHFFILGYVDGARCWRSRATSWRRGLPLLHLRLRWRQEMLDQSAQDGLTYTGLANSEAM